MSTTYTILEYLWGSPQLAEGFSQVAERNDEPYPSLHSMFFDLTHAMAHLHYDWYTVGADEDGPRFDWILHTAEDWAIILDAMTTDLADISFKRMTGDV